MTVNNEEQNIGGCIDSVSWSDDICVLDSGSTDRTIEIAESKGCRIFNRTLDDWSSHLNWAVRTIPFKHDWVFHIDADERTFPDLVREMQEAVANHQNGHAAFKLRRKDYFGGVWLKHAQLYPTWFVRLFRRDSVTFERSMHHVANIRGTTGMLDGHFDHWPFSKGGVAFWIEKHNTYSTFEAKEQILKPPFQPADALSGDPNKRRKALKALFGRLPFRPLVYFFYVYVFRLGFLDGMAGFHFAVLKAFYEYMISIKIREIREGNRARDVAPSDVRAAASSAGRTA